MSTIRFYRHGSTSMIVLNAPRGEPRRAILDYACTLSDAQCLALHNRLSGTQVHRVTFSAFLGREDFPRTHGPTIAGVALGRPSIGSS